jgi:hypothetical protein
MKRFFLKITLMLILVLGALEGALRTPVFAQDNTCISSALLGDWEADKPKVGNITKAHIEAICEGEILIGYRIHVKTKCYPRLCTWGWAATRTKDPNEFQTVFQTYSANRYLTIKARNNRLYIRAEHDFNQPGKPNRAETAILRKE